MLVLLGEAPCMTVPSSAIGKIFFASLEGTLNMMPCLRKQDDQNIACMKDYICGLGSVALSPLMHTDAH